MVAVVACGRHANAGGNGDAELPDEHRRTADRNHSAITAASCSVVMVSRAMNSSPGGFNRSLQHQEIGDCEHGWSKSIRTLHPREVAFIRASICLVA
ncbi:hypothetical protein [Novosphingobium sp. BL-52-GroH]|uniref:hypothetical protein n=1 Tax=Novosphingobium sp. BL-52-GroH TaxID=3349877 RepID=UPI0038510D62